MKVLITGGSRGIGAAAAKAYRDRGYDVDTPGRDELDLSDAESVEQFIKERIKNYGYDILVNNAGSNLIHEIGELKDKDTAEMMNVNLLSPVRLADGFVPLMKERHFGRIVNVGSIWGVISKPGRSIYSATKHGLHGITMTLALELAPYGILVNTVAPGQTLTDLTRKNNPPDVIRQMEKDIPLGRLARPEEIAEVIYSLGNERNTYITGQQIVVDGGLTIK